MRRERAEELGICPYLEKLTSIHYILVVNNLVDQALLSSFTNEKVKVQ
jgi:hypothetical protein